MSSVAPNIPSEPSIEDLLSPVEYELLAPLLSPNGQSESSLPLPSLLPSSYSFTYSLLSSSPVSARTPSVTCAACAAQQRKGSVGGVCTAVQKCP